jgi:cold shock CspA family protein
MARIKSYSNQQGFGYIEHPEYGDLLFDFESCDFNPAVGDEVEVLQVKKRFDGTYKASRVTCPAKSTRKPS